MNILHRNLIRRHDRAIAATVAGSSLLLLLLLGLFAVALVALALATPPLADAAERYTVAGKDVAIYNLAGRLTVEASKGAAVEVEVSTGGRDAGSITVETGSVGSRQTLRVRYPGKRVVYAEMGHGSATNVNVHKDGTFGDGHDVQWNDRVTVAGSGGGIEAHADLRVLVPAGSRVDLHLAAGEASVTGVNGDLRVEVSSGGIVSAGTRGRLSLGTGSGSIKVGDAQGGDLSVDTGSGDVDVATVTSERLSLETGSGSVNLRRAKADKLLVDTGSGGVHIARNGS